MKSDLLSSLSLPEDVKKLNIDEETQLCREIREKIISTVAKNGGHLSSNLGVVELTLVLHRVFDSPKDKIIFDVGHQSYAHKILTDRLPRFDTIRQKDGLCGFSKPKESEHDPVVSGHSSTAISSALGIAQAMKLQGDDHHVIAVVGDGALTGGLAYEGLNNAGRSDTNIIIVVNYNEMSISKNIGGIAEYLSKLRAKKKYRQVKSTAKRILSAVPVVGKPLSQFVSVLKDALKEKIIESTLFEYLGFEFIGPVDGHNLTDLEEALASAKDLGKPVIVQVNTVKGKGYEPAENNPGEYHGVSGFDSQTGEKPKTMPGFTSAFGTALCELAEKDEKICAITAAMKYGTGLQRFSKAFPQRFFDVGIAEEHAVTFAAGLSAMGMTPVFAVYSSFMQRCYDQLVHDLAIAGLHCVIAVCNCGIVGEDGETHQGLYDIPFLTTIPNVKIYSPSRHSQVKSCLSDAVYKDTGISVVRLPKGCETVTKADGNMLTKRGSDKLILSYGREACIAESAAEKLNVDCLTMVDIWPISDDIVSIIDSYKTAYIFEESSFEGSLGQKLSAKCPGLKAYGVSGFVQHMSYDQALELCGLSESKIIETVGEVNSAET